MRRAASRPLPHHGGLPLRHRRARPAARSARAQNVRDELFRLFESGRGQEIPEIRSTTWASLNAVTEYVDHHRPTRARSDFDRGANRLESAWFGSGSRLKQHAFQLALEMAASN